MTKKYTSSLVVEEKHLACNVGSGDLEVFATPMMMALMENAAMLCVADDLDIERKASFEQLAKAPLSMVFTERGSLTERSDVQLLKAFE